MRGKQEKINGCSLKYTNDKWNWLLGPLLLCPACSHLRLMVWSSAAASAGYWRAKCPWSCSRLCVGNCLLGGLTGCSSLLALLMSCFSVTSAPRRCVEAYRHTSPAVGGRLPQGNLNLAVAEEFCSLWLWAVK